MKKKQKVTAKKMGIGLGITAAVAAAAGAYFLYGSKNAAKNRKMVKSWMLKAKAEVLEQMEKVKSLSKEQYDRVVDNAILKYQKLSGVTKTEAETLAKELKSYWKDIEKKGVQKLARRRTTKRKATKKSN